MLHLIFTFLFMFYHPDSVTGVSKNSKELRNEILSDHSTVTNAELFPYMAAVLKMTNYLGAGALISENWIITAADALYLVRESIRLVRVRLESANYKKGGILYPVKYFQIHPYFDDKRPEFDIALVKLSDTVNLTPRLNPIRLQMRPKKIAITHFIVTSWPPHSLTGNVTRKSFHDSMELMKRGRIMSVTQMHPLDAKECENHQDMLGIAAKGTLMCLDSAISDDPCKRDAGAPVVLNGILWGIASSWRSEDCDLQSEPTFVNLVASTNISSWISATMREQRWKYKKVEHEDDYEDNYI